MSTKFTPGPWKLENPAPDYLRVMAGDQEIAFFNEDSLGVQQFKANGNLVSAAPELYACLEEILDSANNHLCDDYLTAGAKMFIDSVLKKARGENV